MAGEVEHVAVWVGLFVGVVGIVLSVVAIAFTWAVSNEANRLSEQIREGVIKVEHDVESVRESVRDLIREAWERMLPNLDRRPGAAAEAVASESAAGLAAKITANAEGKAPSEEQVDAAADLIRAQFRSPALARTTAERFSRTLDALDGMSLEARELARQLRGHHLTPEQVTALQEGVLGDALRELVTSGLLGPLRSSGKEGVVYYFPSEIASLVRVALDLLPASRGELKAQVTAELRRVGYERERQTR